MNFDHGENLDASEKFFGSFFVFAHYRQTLSKYLALIKAICVML
jgi:hypothetical protein